jgi:cysteinyl-tRNA synthetase
MSLRLYNTMTRSKEAFVPLHAPIVKIYLCGPTVYDLLHVGNFRGPIFCSFVRNWLLQSGYQVTFVQNYTDIDDKIINRAREESTSSEVIALKYMAEYKADFEKLGLRPFDLNPTVTESLPQIIELIAELVQKNKAYAANGDVLFSIESFSEYGKLSNRKTEDLLNNVKVEGADYKKNPLDFALWKASKPGEPFWPSPWGPGRPGWHIECSAMIRQHLGESIDIHAGGMDLIFPHHENEIAQSEAVAAKPLAKYWMHWNMLEFGGAKMSKSIGNVRTGRSFMQEFHPEILKYMVLSAHYRSTIDFSEDSISLSITALARIYSAMALAGQILKHAADNVFGKSKLADGFDKAWAGCELAFNDDFNTAEALARIFESVRQFNATVKRSGRPSPSDILVAADFLSLMKKYSELTEIFKESPREFLTELDSQIMRRNKIDRAQVVALVEERRNAREAKDFAKSDEVRAQLVALGISVSDTIEGQHWEVMK